MYNYPYFGLPNYMNYIRARNIPNMQGSPPPINQVASHNMQKSNSDFCENRTIPIRPGYIPKAHYNNGVYGFPKSEVHRNTYEYANMQSNNFNKKTLPPPPHIPKNNSTAPSPIIDIFGIQLYLDDILIICLIFFLFNEQSTDYFLLFTLALLLLT